MGICEGKLRPGVATCQGCAGLENSCIAPVRAPHWLKSPIMTRGIGLVAGPKRERSECSISLRICARRLRPDRSRCAPITAILAPPTLSSAKAAPRGSKLGRSRALLATISILRRTSKALPCQPILRGRRATGTARHAVSSSAARSKTLALSPSRKSASCKAMMSASNSRKTARMRKGSRRLSVPTAL